LASQVVPLPGKNNKKITLSQQVFSCEHRSKSLIVIDRVDFRLQN